MLLLTHALCIKAFAIPTIACFHLVFVEHLVEGVIQLARDSVDLQLLPNDLVLQLVNPEKRNQWVWWGLSGWFWWFSRHLLHQYKYKQIYRYNIFKYFYRRWSLVMFISAYSDRESDSFSLMFSCLIWSWNKMAFLSFSTFNGYISTHWCQCCQCFLLLLLNSQCWCW